MITVIEDIEKLEPLLVGMWSYIATLKNNLTFKKKLNANSHMAQQIHFYLWKMKTYLHTITNMWMFKPALFILTKNWK